MYYCFGCGAGGNVFTFLMEYENFTFVEAVKYLADRAGDGTAGDGIFQRGEREGGFEGSRYWRSIRQAAKYFYVQLKSEQGKQAYTYLKDRELSDETITAFRAGIFQ